MYLFQYAILRIEANTVIISTKIQVPIIHTALVQRDALMKRLHNGIQGKLTVVAAPAGYGKTTLLSEWVKECNGQAAWVSLGKQENNFERFWSYVIAAIEKANPGFGATLQPILANVQPAFFEPMITALLCELGSLPGRLVLIMDDFHVIELPSINSSMAYLLEHLPSHIHIVIASRSQLNLPTARLQVRGELHSIMLKDLRFQVDEGIHFFKTVWTCLSPKRMHPCSSITRRGG
jgi:LuxR family maltose regulon positive regulatory protein